MRTVSVYEASIVVVCISEGVTITDKTSTFSNKDLFLYRYSIRGILNIRILQYKYN